MAEFTIAGLVEDTAARVPDRPAIVSGELVRTYAELVDRSRRLARWLADRGLGAVTARAELAGHEAGQDRLAQYLLNGPEYLEGLVGSFRARVAPVNVNHRYVAGELRHLLRDAAPRAVQFHARFASLLAEVLPDVPSVEVLLQVGDDEPLLPGAVGYEDALASVPPDPAAMPEPDDLYVLYTGGTTGLPKGVLWRQADALVSLMNVRNAREDREWASAGERLAAVSRRGHRVLPLAPYMHGAAQFAALQALVEGNTVVVASDVARLDPDGVWDDVARHRVTTMSIVGDAFARPLADALEARPRELPDLRYLISGGAALSAVHKERLVAAVPGLTVIESIGASETGVQGRATGVAGRPLFARSPTTRVLSEDCTRFLAPGHDGTGWLATAGRVPLGYLGDAGKTAATFPVVDGERLSVPGDRARLLDGDLVELLGRDSTTINTGGEKVFAEEVEDVVRTHPGVLDAVVCGRASERWGAEVVAVVALRPGAALDLPALAEHCAGRLARYKIPRAVVLVDEVRRSPSGKPDVGWARATAATAPTRR